jgi:hypothetical protein
VAGAKSIFTLAIIDFVTLISVTATRRGIERFKLSTVNAQTHARHSRRINAELLTMVSMQAYIKAITGFVPNLP